VPSWYGYHLWFREPIGLKLAILGHGGPLRFLPYIFALCVAGVLQVVVLQVQVVFRLGLVIVLLQWAATVVAGYILALLFGVGLDAARWTPPTATVANAPDRAHKQKAAGKAAGKKTAAKGTKAHDATHGDQADAEPSSLAMIKQEAEQATQAPREYLKDAATNLKDYADSHLEEVNEELEPVTKHLPEPVRHFLE